MTKDGIGAYEKLLNTIGMELDDPYWERERGIRVLADKLNLLEDDGWLDTFMEMNDVQTALEGSCWYEEQTEHHYDLGHEAGRESAYEDMNEDHIERVDDWLDKLVNFLKDKWVNLNKNQIQEVEDYLNAYPVPE